MCSYTNKKTDAWKISVNSFPSHERIFMYLFGSYHCISEYTAVIYWSFHSFRKFWNRVMNLIKNVINPIRSLFSILFHFLLWWKFNNSYTLYAVELIKLYYLLCGKKLLGKFFVNENFCISKKKFVLMENRIFWN